MKVMAPVIIHSGKRSRGMRTQSPSVYTSFHTAAWQKIEIFHPVTLPTVGQKRGQGRDADRVRHTTKRWTLCIN